MGQEFFIKSDGLESKVRELLPSQGGLGQGFDLSASTQIVPIVDLTESAEGSNLRSDLQSSLSLDSVTSFNISNTTSTLINNTGYFRVFGNLNGFSVSTGARTGAFTLTDGVTNKTVQQITLAANTSTNNAVVFPYDFLVFIKAGQSLTANTSNSDVKLSGVTRQIATIDGELVDP